MEALAIFPPRRVGPGFVLSILVCQGDLVSRSSLRTGEAAGSWGAEPSRVEGVEGTVSFWIDSGGSLFEYRNFRSQEEGDDLGYEDGRGSEQGWPAWIA